MNKIMIDTNVFDFILDNQLIDLIKKLYSEKLIELHITHVQMDQIRSIVDETKKQSLLSIPFKQVLLSVGWTTDDNESGGFKGPRADHFMAVNSDDAIILEECLKDRVNRSQRIFGDMGIIFTSFKEDMDYVVSADRDMKQFYDCLKGKIQSDLQYFTLNDFSLFLKNLKN